MIDQNRGTGRTTRQMKSAPEGAHFVWCTNNTDYPKKLALRHGRPDLKIVGRGYITSNRSMGTRPTGIVVDHNLFDVMSELERDFLRMWTTRVVR